MSTYYVLRPGPVPTEETEAGPAAVFGSACGVAAERSGRNTDSGATVWDSFLAGCVFLGKLLKGPGPQFPHLYTGL